MEFDLCPPVSLREGTFNVLVAPEEMFILALNRHLNLQRFRTLYISGNFSRVLSKLDRRFTDLDIRRSFTAYQLLTILEESHHSIVLIEHDPSLYEGARDLPEYVSLAMKGAASSAIVLLYAPALDRYIDEISKTADRIFCFGAVNDEQYRQSGQSRQSKQPSRHQARICLCNRTPKIEGSQTTLEAF